VSLLLENNVHESVAHRLFPFFLGIYAEFSCSCFSICPYMIHCYYLPVCMSLLRRIGEVMVL